MDKSAAIQTGNLIKTSKTGKSKLKEYTRNYELYLMLVLPFAFLAIFHYWPLYGIQIAFRDFNVSQGMFGSPWVGLKHFARIFNYYAFWQILWNTVSLNLYNLAIGFPAPIILALLVNEVRSNSGKRIIQNITYMPHFLSVVVIVGLLANVTSVKSGVINIIIKVMGGQPINFMIEGQYFKSLFVFSEVWQNIGWSAVIYIAAIAGISQELYEAAVVDGATKLQRILNITIPGIMPTAIILLILRLGHLFNVGFVKVLLMQNNATISASDVISTYMYRTGILEGNFSYATAVGLFNSLCNITVLIIANTISRKVSESSLW